MSTLIMRLAGPMQSWGTAAKFNVRGTEQVPTKSGVIGLLAAALGRKRNESLDDLCALNFGVRVEKEGVLLEDFHMAHEENFWQRPHSKSSRTKFAHLTNRYYLADAVFLVALEGEESFLELIEAALAKPAYPLYLGRRSCPPEGRICLGIRRGVSLSKALLDEPWQLSDWQKRSTKKESFRIVRDAEDKDMHTYLQQDFPLSYDQTSREYSFRTVTEYYQHRTEHEEKVLDNYLTEHDALSELEGV